MCWYAIHVHRSIQVQLHDCIVTKFCYEQLLIDRDECQSTPCDHTCTNTEGSFECSCRSGYELQDDKKTCEGMLIELYGYPCVFWGI